MQPANRNRLLAAGIAVLVAFLFLVRETLPPFLIAFAIAAVYFGARVAMGFGRDLLRSLFHRVTGFSAREVGAFGAPQPYGRGSSG